MHRIWYVEDIRILIFKILENGDLARLARTCKVFFDMATDQLWALIDSFRPLVCWLPPNVGAQKLTLNDVKRLDFYAGKIKVILLEEKSVEKIIYLPPPFVGGPEEGGKHPRTLWVDLWQKIAELRPNHFFMPNLISIRVSNIVEELLRPLVGISGTRLASIYIKYIHERRPENITRLFLDGLGDTPKLEYLFVRDGEADLLPSELIKNSPLTHLRLDPRIYAMGRHQNQKFKQFPLRTEILQKSSLEKLTMGLTRQWRGPEYESVKQNYLPGLKHLRLNLRTFRAERCNSSCVNISENSWTCLADGSPNVGVDGTSSRVSDCGRRPPTLFLQGLDNPELNLLEIKFPYDIAGNMFREVVQAARETCRLSNLAELMLDDGGWFDHCPECGSRPVPKVTPQDLRAAILPLLPMHRLRVLRLSIGRDLLKDLDLEFYKLMADGLPELEMFSLGHPTLITSSEFGGLKIHEKVNYHHMAAFGHFFPNLSTINVICIDASARPFEANEEWVCPHIKTFEARMINQGVEEIPANTFLRNMDIYFPNSDLSTLRRRTAAYLDAM